MDEGGLTTRGLVIRLCDDQAKRRRRVAATLATAAPAAQLIEQTAAALADPNPDALTVVAFDHQPPEPILAAVRRLRGHGAAVLGYGTGSGGWSLVRRCQILLAGAPVVLDAAAADFEDRLIAQVQGRLDALAQRCRVDRRLARVMGDLGMVGDSPPWQSALLAIERSARLSDMPVLLLGESGTGKDLLARALHRLDQRRCGQPFVAINCAAVTRSLVEAELFGHRKGAYSGADRDRPGLLRAADGGVLFLDEIGDLDLEIQAKLLRVIQERRVLPLGDTQEIPLDVRIVAATHRDLKALVEQQRFRADLLNRLWVYPVEVPPLRRRRSDIRSLVHSFLCKHGGVSAATLPVNPAFYEALELAELPGNVRQLESIVQRALALNLGGRALDLGDLPPELWAELAERAPPEPPPASQTSNVDLNLNRALCQHERTLVEAALAASGGNQAQAARLLGITARSMYTKLRKHSLNRRSHPAPP